jgi:hypothetical protein
LIPSDEILLHGVNRLFPTLNVEDEEKNFGNDDPNFEALSKAYDARADIAFAASSAAFRNRKPLDTVGRTYGVPWFIWYTL